MEAGDYSNGKDIEKLLNNQVLNAFISGVPDSYRLILKARNASTLNEALAIALEEGAAINSVKATHRLLNNQPDNRNRNVQPHKTNFSSNRDNRRECFKCGRTNHIARDYRASVFDQTQYKRRMQTGSSQIASPQTDSRVKTVLICKYCKKVGHTLEKCRKRKYINSKRILEENGTSVQTENHESGNGQELNSSSAR